MMYLFLAAISAVVTYHYYKNKKEIGFWTFLLFTISLLSIELYYFQLGERIEKLYNLAGPGEGLVYSHSFPENRTVTVQMYDWHDPETVGEFIAYQEIDKFAMRLIYLILSTVLLVVLGYYLYDILRRTGWII